MVPRVRAGPAPTQRLNNALGGPASPSRNMPVVAPVTDPLAKSLGYGLGSTKPPSPTGGKGKEPMDTHENGLGHLFVPGVPDTSASLALGQAIGTLNVLSTTGDHDKDVVEIDDVNATSTEWVAGTVKTSQRNSATKSRMSHAKEAQDDTQVGAAAEVNDPGVIPWRMTDRRAGVDDVMLAKVSARIGVSRKQSTFALSGKTVTFDPQGAELVANGDEDGVAGGGVAGEGGGAARGDVTRTAAESKKLRRKNRNQVRNVDSSKSPSQKRGRGDEYVGSD